MDSVFIDCSSPLLQRNLERELQKRIKDRDSAEVIITDYLQCDKCVKIGIDIEPPLFFNNIMAQLSPEEPIDTEEEPTVKPAPKSGELRDILRAITDRYIDDVIKATEEFYEGKR
jgi:hypothetical protein